MLKGLRRMTSILVFWYWYFVLHEAMYPTDHDFNLILIFQIKKTPFFINISKNPDNPKETIYTPK